MKEFVANEMATMHQKVLDDVLRRTIHIVQSCVRSVVYNVIERVMLNLLRKGIIEKR